jgi:hypothetical protein
VRRAVRIGPTGTAGIAVTQIVAADRTADDRWPAAVAGCEEVHLDRPRHARTGGLTALEGGRERGAWDLMEHDGGGIELVVVNPTFIRRAHPDAEALPGQSAESLRGLVETND